MKLFIYIYIFLLTYLPTIPTHLSSLLHTHFSQWQQTHPSFLLRIILIKLYLSSITFYDQLDTLFPYQISLQHSICGLHLSLPNKDALCLLPFILTTHQRYCNSEAYYIFLCFLNYLISATIFFPFLLWLMRNIRNNGI